MESINELTRALWGFAVALGLTVAVEAPVAWLLGLRSVRGQLALLLINVITNPTLNLLTNLLAYFGIYTISSPADPVLIALEFAVVVIESVLLKTSLGLPTGRSMLLSAACNAASWFAGALLLWH